MLVRTPYADGSLLAAYKAPLLAKDVPTLHRRLTLAINELRRTNLDDRRDRFPVVITDAAQPGTIAACERERLGVIDQTGTILLHDGPIFVHVAGRGRVTRRARAALFRGKSVRILNYLFLHVGEAEHAKRIGEETQTSFAYCHAVLKKLESQGFVNRPSPRGGFRLVRPVELLREWSESGGVATATVEPFYAPSTEEQVLARLEERLKKAGQKFSLTLASALQEDEVFVGGIPHGLYLGGDASPVIETLELKRTTPHNFLILRPSPDLAATDYGVFRSSRVCPTQLILDVFAYGGARGREQGEHLLRRFAADLPLLAEPS